MAAFTGKFVRVFVFRGFNSGGGTLGMLEGELRITEGLVRGGEEEPSVFVLSFGIVGLKLEGTL